MTAQPSPDLPDSLQRQTKPAGEDVYQAAAEAYCGPVENWLRPARDRGVEHHRDNPAFRAAVDEAVRLTEQRVRAEMAAEIEAARREGADERDAYWRATRERDAAEFVAVWDSVATIEAERDQARADLAAMTARAESAEAMYDQARADVDRLAGHCADLAHNNEVQGTEIERLRGTGDIADAAIAYLNADENDPSLLDGGLYIDLVDAVKHWRAVTPADRLDGTGPLSAPSATESVDGVSNVDAEGSEGQRGSEGVSGGAA